MSVIAHNPVMPGFYPDPSICAVGGDYYLVNSTFACFPGLPIMHSRDLCHWEQIGNALNRASQLPLQGAGHSAGLFAPTIRYHDGTFYLICTNVSGGGNFIVTASDPEGPWSEPYFIQGADGIDPSLFFDDDGKCYYIGTHPNPQGCRYNGDWYIWIQELDTAEMKLKGEHKNVWNGAMRDIIWPEGPHLYKKDGWYYIMHAEGGTGPEHAVTVCRSRSIWGPYENNFCNPILTHRHLGQDYPIKYVGHGDLFETPEGEWYMVMLAVRPLEGYTTMGRETFLARVVWEKGWPVVNPGAGMLTEEVEIRLPEWDPLKEKESFTVRSRFRNCVPGSSREYDFARGTVTGKDGAVYGGEWGEQDSVYRDVLGDEFLFLRNPDKDMYRLKEGEGLYLKFGSVTLKEEASPSFVAVRQQHHSFEAGAAVEAGVLGRLQADAKKRWQADIQEYPQADIQDHLQADIQEHPQADIQGPLQTSVQKHPQVGEKSVSYKAGLALMQNNEYHLRLELSAGKAQAILCEKGVDKVLGSAALNGGEGSGETELFLRVEGLSAVLGVREEGKEKVLARDVDIRSLSTEVAGGFVGCIVGMYAVAEREAASAGAADTGAADAGAADAIGTGLKKTGNRDAESQESVASTGTAKKAAENTVECRENGSADFAGNEAEEICFRRFSYWDRTVS